MANGNQKGGQFERDICVILSNWWSKGKNPDVFWRSQGSGGRATRRFRKHGKNLAGHDGDISATHKSGEKLLKLFTIELKRGYGKTCIFDVLDRPKKKKNSKIPSQQMWETWIEQIDTVQSRSKTIGWFLIHQRNGRVPFIYYSFGVYSKLFNEVIRIKKPFLHVKIDVVMKQKGQLKEIVVFGSRLDYFLEKVDPEKVKAIYDEIKKQRKAKKHQAEEFPETQKDRDKTKSKNNNDSGSKRLRKKRRN